MALALFGHFVLNASQSKLGPENSFRGRANGAGSRRCSRRLRTVRPRTGTIKFEDIILSLSRQAAARICDAHA
jgi:hypothetical protein